MCMSFSDGIVITEFEISVIENTSGRQNICVKCDVFTKWVNSLLCDNCEDLLVTE